MNKSTIRNALLVAGIAATMGIGVVGCGETADRQAGANDRGSATDRQAGANDRQAGANEEMTDTAITAGVKSKLAMERDLDSSDIDVTTDNGAVTLTGDVNNAAARSAAETAARSVAGVTNVNNRLSLSNTRVASGSGAESTGGAVVATGDNATQAMSDTWITTKIKSVLLADSEAKGLDINVDTKDGVVTLEGELSSQAAIDHVKALASDVEGVKRVDLAGLTVARR